MKTLAFLVLSWLSLVSAAPSPLLRKRQTAIQGLVESMVKGMNAWTLTNADPWSEKPSKIVNIKRDNPLKPGSISKRYQFGPYVIPAQKADMDAEAGHTHLGPDWKDYYPPEYRSILSMLSFFWDTMDPNAYLVTRMLGGLCRDCTILSSQVLLVDENGEPLGVDRGIYQHHVNMLSMTKSVDEPSFAATCPENDTSWFPVGGYSRPVGMDITGHVYATQAIENQTIQFTPSDGSILSGLYSDGGPVVMGAEIVNYQPVNRSVYIAVDLEYLNGKQGQNAIYMPLSVIGCLTGEFGYFFDGETNTRSSGKFQIFNDGHIFGMRGHLHDGGDSVSLYVNDKFVCKSKAGYGGPGAERKSRDGRVWRTISSMTECEKAVPVKRGDKLELKVHYDLNEHPLRISKGQKAEAMGLMWLGFVPEKER